MAETDKKMTFYIYTLGCKVNRYESCAMEAALSQSGRFVPAGEDRSFDADIFIINSCVVTEESEKKAAKLARRARRTNPENVIVLCGCLPQTALPSASEIDADIVFGTKERNNLISFLDEFLSQKERKKLVRVSAFEKKESFEILPPESFETRTRANLKIEDGCNRFCAYCIIPYARGPVRSMPVADIARQAKNLVKAGHREIIITGINIGMYGTDIGNTLIDAYNAVKDAGAERIRLGSLEADLLSDELLDFLAKEKTFCPQFHVSAQSGSDSVLKRMRRRYTVSEYESLIAKIRRKFDNPTVTTDIIVGFPGETDSEFCETLDFARRVSFSKVHVFPYSSRPGTAAAMLPDHIGPEIKKSRAAIMGETADNLSEAFFKSQLGKRAEVLFETFSDGFYCGHSKNYLYVKVKSERNLKNKIEEVILTEVFGGGCLGELVGKG